MSPKSLHALPITQNCLRKKRRSKRRQLRLLTKFRYGEAHRSRDNAIAKTVIFTDLEMGAACATGEEKGHARRHQGQSEGRGGYGERLHCGFCGKEGSKVSELHTGEMDDFSRL